MLKVCVKFSDECTIWINAECFACDKQHGSSLLINLLLTVVAPAVSSPGCLPYAYSLQLIILTTHSQHP